MIIHYHSRTNNNKIEFKRLKEEHLEMVLKWRTQPDVTKYMATDIEYNLEKQKQWFQIISKDTSSKYWIITFNTISVGLIALVNINWTHKYTIWDYYIGEAKYRSALGGIVPLYLYNYIFKDLKLNKIFANVMVENKGTIKIFQLHGFRNVGVCKQHYYKNDRYHDVLMMELLAEKWKAQNDRFGKYVGFFE
jgi:hypothetical protein